MDSRTMQRIRDEALRWKILCAIDSSRPIPLSELLLRRAMHDPPAFPVETAKLRRELDWLRDRELITIGREETGNWILDIEPAGQDFVANPKAHPIEGVSPPPED